jgi:hypothetical protein
MNRNETAATLILENIANPDKTDSMNRMVPEIEKLTVKIKAEIHKRKASITKEALMRGAWILAHQLLLPADKGTAADAEAAATRAAHQKRLEKALAKDVADGSVHNCFKNVLQQSMGSQSTINLKAFPIGVNWFPNLAGCRCPYYSFCPARAAGGCCG